MTATYIDLQAPPGEVLSQEIRCRRALEASAAHLVRTAEHLAGAAPAYDDALQQSLQAIRQAYTALLEWHSLSPVADAPLGELAAAAQRLANVLRTCWDVTFTIAPLEGIPGGGLPVVVRERAETSYYTARNTLAVVIGSLPERITGDAVGALNRAQAIRIGRIEPAGEAALASKTVRARAARLRPVATV